MKNELAYKAFRNTSGAVVYIFLVSQIMQNGERIFGNVDNIFIGPFVFLMLFSLSAAIVGGLVFGQALILFLDNKKKESIKAAIYSVGWLGAYTILGLLTLIIAK